MTTLELFGTPERQVMDPVHGGIPLFEHEVRVIDHPLFQRLRHILQNDVLFLVFPGARHSRFEHSIGAMHIAGRFFKSVVRSYLRDTVSPPLRPVARDDAEAARYFSMCVRLAALLHDTGHAPFAHQFENSTVVRSLLNKADLVANLWPDETWKAVFASPPTRLKHEHYSVWCAEAILSDLDSEDPLPVAVADVLAILETTDVKPTEAFCNHARQLYSLFMAPNEEAAPRVVANFLKAIISGELDVDKMDYLLRDSTFSGCRYGLYNLDHLLSTIRLSFGPTDNWLGLGIDYKGLGALEDFVHSRFQLYLQLYFHKTVTGFKWLLGQAMDEVLAEPATAAFVGEALRSRSVFQHFTDTYFWECFRSVARRYPGSASARLTSRRRLQCLGVGQNMAAFEVASLKDELAKRYSTSVVEWTSDAKFSKLGQAYSDLRVVVRDPKTGRRELKSVRSQSSFFEKFQGVSVTHFFDSAVSASA